MKDKHSKDDGQVAQGERSEIDDELIEAARSYFASDFPNKERTGCPPAKTVRAVAQSSSLPSDELRSHLFTCSECFYEYRSALALRRSAVPARSAARWSNLAFSPRLAFAFATVIVLLALSVLIVTSLRQRAASPESIVGERDDQAVTSSNEQGATTVKQSEGSPANKNSTPQLALNYREIDLASYSRYRGGVDEGGSPNKPIQLRASFNHLLFRMPQGSEQGSYVVSVVDRAFLDPLETTTGSSSDGKTLAVTLDLRRLAPKDYLLLISREGEAPAYYSVGVQPRTDRQSK